MQNLNKFRLNLEKINSLENIIILKNYIENFFLQDELKTFISESSLHLDLDEKILSLKCKRLLAQKFVFENNKFEDNFSFIKLIYQFFIFFGLLIKITFSKNQNSIVKKNIMLFNVDSIDEIEKFKKVLSECNNSVIITKTKLNLNKISNHIRDKYLKENLIFNYEKDNLKLTFRDKDEKYSLKTDIISEDDLNLDGKCIKKKYSIFKFAINLLIKSILFKFNFLQIFNILLYAKVKNYSIFSKYQTKYFLQDRINYTCPIRNHLFKKMGGVLSGCVQTHLTEASISLFNDIDLFMTFGDEQHSKKLLTLLGSRIGKSIPIGSLRVESFLYNSSKEFNNKMEIDVLVFGVNLYNWLHINNNAKKNYYKFLEYLKTLSNNYKNLKIVFKHHPNNVQDEKEMEIMKNSNIIYLDKKINSYSLINNSKLFFSYSSTLIVETSGIYGKSYFIDPNNNNNIFFDKNSHFNKIKLVDYSDLEKIVETIIYKKNTHKNVSNEICLDSKNVSKLIIDNLRRPL